MSRLALFATLAIAPLAFAEAPAPVAEKPAPARVAAAPEATTPEVAARQESLGVVPVKVTPSLVEKLKGLPPGRTLAAVAEGIDNRLTAALAASRKFKVVTRSDLAAVLAEQNLAASGNLDADDPQLAKRFKLAGAASILLVTIDDFQDREEVAKFEASGETLRRRILRVGATAKLLDTTTGVVRESVSIPAITQEDLRGVLAKITNSADRAEALAPEVAKLLAERISQRLVDAKFPAKVLAKTENIITFNRGEGSGVTVGQTYAAYALGEEMKDPDTGESLGREEVLIGRAVVTEVGPKFSKAELTTDQGVTKGAIIRLLPAKE